MFPSFVNSPSTFLTLAIFEAGVPSELTEEDVKAFVIPAPGDALDVAALHAFAREQLARYKMPRYYEVVPELPHTPTGRLAKHRLPRERTSEEIDMEVGS